MTLCKYKLSLYKLEKENGMSAESRLLAKLEDYGFECEAGDLSDCQEFIELESILNTKKEVCPFPNCGKPLRLSKEVYGYCFECTCGYKSQYSETKEGAMESHNLLLDMKVTGDPWPNEPWVED